MFRIWIVSALLLLTASTGFAWEPYPAARHGYDGLIARAILCSPKIHMHGPLYNYGPYYGGEGYNTMWVENPRHGAYIPAYPASYYGMGGYAEGGGGYPVGSSTIPSAVPATNGTCVGCNKPAVTAPKPTAVTKSAPVATPSLLPAGLEQLVADDAYFGSPLPGYFKASQR